MRKSTRALVGLVAIDLLLVLGAAWLVLQVRSGAATTTPPGEAITTITTMFGAAIGVVTGVLGVAFAVHRRRGN